MTNSLAYTVHYQPISGVAEKSFSFIVETKYTCLYFLPLYCSNQNPCWRRCCVYFLDGLRVDTVKQKLQVGNGTARENRGKTIIMWKNVVVDEIQNLLNLCDMIAKTLNNVSEIQKY